MSRSPNLARASLAAACLLASVLVAAPHTASADILEVDSLADDGPGSLRAAVDKANTNVNVIDTIVFAKDLSGTITLTTGEIAVLDTLIIDASDAGGVEVSGNGASRIFNVQDAHLTIRRLQLINGHSGGGGGGAVLLGGGDLVLVDAGIADSSSDGIGGGVQTSGSVTVRGGELKANSSQYGGAINAGSVLIEDGAVIRDNSASFGGGGIYVPEGLIVRDSFLIDNTACTEPGAYPDGGGGAVALFEPVTISGSVISGNSCANRTGGGLHVYEGATLDISNTVFDGNSAQRGGGLAVSDLMVTIDGTTFRQNTATISGGAFSALTAPATITDSVFGGNETGSGAGGAIRVNSDLSITESTLTDNDAGSEGGAIDVSSSELTLTDSTLSRNTAVTSGGAISADRGRLVVTGGEISDNTAGGGGGGISVRRIADLRVEGTTFSRNEATGSGGALSIDKDKIPGEANLVMTDVELAGNSSGSTGGAALVRDFDVATFTAVRAFDNVADRGGGFAMLADKAVAFNGGEVLRNTARDGGAFHAESTDLAIDGTTISDNVATGDGGGISTNGEVDLSMVSMSGNIAEQAGGAIAGATADAEIEISESTLASNRAATGDGGAIANEGGTTIIVESSLLDNEAALDGGAVSGQLVFVEDSTFAQNEAGGDGGAIRAASELFIAGSTLSANVSGGRGGAMSSEGDDDSVAYLTATGNTAAVSGGGIHNDSTSASGVSNSIIFGNEAPVAADIEMSAAPRYSIVGEMGSTPVLDDDGRPADGLLVGVDPLLGPLADNGGPTLTHALDARSAAIDAARPSNGVLTDQRGVERTVGTGPDAGAIEYEGLLPVWIPIRPARLADTRSAGETIDGRFRGAGLVPGGQFVEIDIAGRGGVPVTATGAIVNVTAIRPAAVGFLTVYPCTEVLPNASSVNYTVGVNLPNEIAAGLSTVGSICIYSREDTHIAVDVVGYVAAPSPFVPVEPGRLLDTRDLGATVDGRFRATGRRTAGSELELHVAGRYGIPADAAAVVVNVTAVRPSARGFLTVHGCVDERPLSSSLNYVAGGNRANEILAGLDADGNLCVYTQSDTDMLVDVVGYLPAGTDLAPVEPARVFESRENTSTVDGLFAGGGKLAAGTTTRVQIAGRAGVDENATTVNINVTAVAASSRGYLTVFPCGDQPLASSLNYVPGVNGGNDVIAELDTGGGLCVFNFSETHLTIDVAGFTTL